MFVVLRSPSKLEYLLNLTVHGTWEHTDPSKIHGLRQLNPVMLSSFLLPGFEYRGERCWQMVSRLDASAVYALSITVVALDIAE
jgi:hypothetical protein